MPRYPFVRLNETDTIRQVAQKANFNFQSLEDNQALIREISEVTGDIGGLGQKVIDLNQQLVTHVGDTSNPHATTKSQVGLSDVDNTSDLAKPISTATQTALDAKLSGRAGTATIPANSASTTITHGLSATPIAILLTPFQTAVTSEIMTVTARTGTSFTVARPTAPATTLGFSWLALR
jgi:hypothetical protein